MKKLILLFAILFGATIAMAQDNGRVVGDGMVIHDTLFNVGTGPTAASDSSKMYNFNYLYDLIVITIQDTGATYTDSIKAYRGVQYYYDNRGDSAGVFWNNDALFVIEPGATSNVRTIDTTMTGAGKILSYIVEDSDGIGWFKLSRVNAEVVDSIQTRFTIEAVRKHNK